MCKGDCLVIMNNSKKEMHFLLSLFSFLSVNKCLVNTVFYILWTVWGPKKELGVHERKQKEILFCLVFKNTDLNCNPHKIP